MSKNDVDRYLQAQHAMQIAVKIKLQHDPKDTSPKSLRVGINTAMCDHTALVKLLLKKGIISEEEYEKEIADEMDLEVDRYKKLLAAIGLSNHWI